MHGKKTLWERLKLDHRLRTEDAELERSCLFCAGCYIRCAMELSPTENYTWESYFAELFNDCVVAVR